MCGLLLLLLCLVAFSNLLFAQDEDLPKDHWDALLKLTQGPPPPSDYLADRSAYVEAIPQMLTAIRHPELFDHYQMAYVRAIALWLSDVDIAQATVDKRNVARELAFLVLRAEPKPLPAYKTIFYKTILSWCGDPEVLQAIPVAELIEDQFQNRADTPGALYILDMLLKLTTNPDPQRRAIARQALSKITSSSHFTRIQQSIDPEADPVAYALVQRCLKAKSALQAPRGIETLTPFELLGEVYFRIMLALTLQVEQMETAMIGKAHGKLDAATAERLESLNGAIVRLNRSFGQLFCTQQGGSFMASFVKFGRLQNAGLVAVLTIVLQDPELDGHAKSVAQTFLNAALKAAELGAPADVEAHLATAAAEPLASVDALVSNFGKSMVPAADSSSRSVETSALVSAIEKLRMRNDEIPTVITEQVRQITSATGMTRTTLLSLPAPLPAAVR